MQVIFRPSSAPILKDMFLRINIDNQAKAFLDALFDYSVRQNKRITASGDPDANQDNFTMMTLHTKLRAVPHSSFSWQDYSENILNTAEAYRLHLRAGGYYGAPIVGSALSEIRLLLHQHAPQPTDEGGLLSRLARLRNV